MGNLPWQLDRQGQVYAKHHAAQAKSRYHARMNPPCPYETFLLSIQSIIETERRLKPMVVKCPHKANAFKAGLRTYEAPYHCAECGGDRRYTVSGNCVECAKVAARKSASTAAGKLNNRARQARFRSRLDAKKRRLLDDI
jgi:uncharacterized protein YjiS (DUF1127 family)